MSSTCCVAHKGFYKPNSRIEFKAEVAAQRFQESTAGGSVDIKKTSPKLGRSFGESV